MYQAPQFTQPNVAFNYGSVFIRPVGAQLTHDTDFFFKMDPFAKFTASNGTHMQTNVCHGGGKKPHWNDQLELNVSSNDVITIEIWDHNTVGSNEAVATGQLQVAKIVAMGGQYQDYVPLFYRGKPAGDLNCSWTYKTTQNQGFQQQQQFVPQQQFVQQGFPQQQFVQQQSYPQQQQQYQQTTVIQSGGYPQQQVNFSQQQFPKQTTVVEEVIIQNQNHGHHHNHHHQQQPQVVVEEIIVQNPGHHGHHHQNQVVVEEVIITQPQHHNHHHHNNNW